MTRPLWGAVVLLASFGPAWGGPMLELSGVPGSFVPGQDVTFDILLRDATDLASYNIVLTLQLAAGTIGTDAHFIVPGAALSHYVFGLDTTYFAAAVQTVGATQALAISDFHDPDGDGTLNGVDTVAGTNDRVVTVTVSTHADTCGDLSLFFDTVALELDTPLTDSHGAPVPIDGFTTLRSSLAAQSPVGVSAVPEPASLSLTVLALIAAVAGRRRLPPRVA
jgi:hypothetical protein